MSEERAYIMSLIRENDKLKEEIKRLNNDIKELFKENSNKEKVIKTQDNIIKQYDKVSFIHEMELHKRIEEAIEYIKEKYDYLLGDDTFLDHDERIDRKRILRILDILKGVDKE